MKKIFTLVLAMLMMLSFSVVTFAEEAVPTTKDENAAIKAEIKVLKDELLGLREQHKTIRAQVVEKRTEIKALLKTAKEADLTDKIEAAKAFREQLKAINDEIRMIREDKKALWEQLKAARTNKDFETIKANLTQIIEYKKQIIAKANSRFPILDDIINSLK